MPDPAIDSLFAEIDADETGSISYWQFLSWWKQQDQAAGLRVSDEQYNSSRELFLSYADDGGLSPDGLEELIGELELGQYVPVEEDDDGEEEEGEDAHDLAVVDDSDALLEGLESMDRLLSSDEDHSEGENGDELALLDGLDEISIASTESSDTDWDEFDTGPSVNSTPLAARAWEGAELLSKITTRVNELHQTYAWNGPYEWAGGELVAIKEMLQKLANCPSPVAQNVTAAAQSEAPAATTESANTKTTTPSVNASSRLEPKSWPKEGHLWRMFCQFDSDGSGEIDPDEFEALCAKLDPSMSQQEMQRALAIVDYDMDGQVSFDEFCTWWTSLTDEGSHSAKDDQDAELREAFEVFDADGSGAIDPEEFAALCRQLDPSMTQEMIDEAINKIDEDGDGEISFGEFRGWWKSTNKTAADSDDSDDEGSVGGNSVLQQRVMAMVLLRKQKKATAAAALNAQLLAEQSLNDPANQLPDLNDPAVRKAADMIFRAFDRMRVRKSAAAWRQRQQEMRALAEEEAAGEPDARAKMLGWKDAEEQNRALYERDLADSYTGGGSGLEWGPISVHETPQDVFLLPSGLLLDDTIDRFQQDKQPPTRHKGAQNFAQAMLYASARKWGCSEAHNALVVAHAAARFKKMLSHHREAQLREEVWTRHMQQQEDEARANARRLAKAKAERRAQMSRGPGKTLSRLWRKARLVLVPASFMVECRERQTKKALKDLDSETLEQVGEVVAILQSKAMGPRSGSEIMSVAQELASQDLHPGIWETTTVDEAVASSGFGVAVSAGFSGGGDAHSLATSGCSAIEAIDQLLLFYGPAGMSPIDELEHEMDFVQDNRDPTALRRTTATSLLLAATGPGGQRAARRAAARICAHRGCREIGVELLRLLNGSETGGVVWTHALAVIAFAVDGLFDMRLTDEGVAYVDTMYSPADQRVLIDILLRQPESIGYKSIAAWRPWLRAATAVLTAAEGYTDSMYKAPELRLAIEQLYVAGLAWSEAEKALLDGCRKVLDIPDPGSFSRTGAGRAVTREYSDGDDDDNNFALPSRSAEELMTEAVTALQQAASADSASRRSGDLRAVLETAMLYLAAAEALSTAAESASVEARPVLLKKQQAVAKRVRALTKKLGVDGPVLVNDAWRRRRGETAKASEVAEPEPEPEARKQKGRLPFPEGGMYWVIPDDDVYREQQGPVSENDMENLMQFQPFWDSGDCRLLVYAEWGEDNTELDNGWQPWHYVRTHLGYEE